MVFLLAVVPSQISQTICDWQLHCQYVIGNFIADFYCHEAKLVVELDGSQHYTPEEIEYDQKRTEFMQSLGLTVLRFSNLDVLRQFECVCQTIDQAIAAEKG